MNSQKAVAGLFGSGRDRRASRLRQAALALTVLALPVAPATSAEETVVSYRVENGAIATPLAGRGDPGRGRKVVLSRDFNCILCHVVPESDVRFMGNLGPPLAGTGARLTEAKLRLRIADSLQLNPDSIMPSYHRVEGLNGVAAQYRGKPVLTAQQVEDVVAYLLTLR